MKLTTRTLPAYWASYLINGDDSGISEAERADCDAYLEHEGLGSPLSCSDESWFSWDNDATTLGGDVMEFTFEDTTHPLFKVRDGLAEAISYGDEHIAEVDSEYRSECALFGDAGPGMASRCQSARSVQRGLRHALRAVERKLRRLRYLSKPGKPVPYQAALAFDDIPF